MALKQLDKRKDSKTVVANVDSPNDRTFRKAALCKVSQDGTVDLNTEAAFFRLNPSTYEDSKSSNWIQQIVPGQSDPVLQWVNSGVRTVSFEALVTADTFSEFQKPGQNTDPLKKAQNYLGDIASAFFKISLPPPRQTIEKSNNKGDSLDISIYLNYYRSLLYPQYGKEYNMQLSRSVTQSPPLLVLYSGNSINKLAIGQKITSNTDVWVLTDLKIRITKQLPNLAPMEATVQFTLIQYNIRSFDSRRFND